MQFSAEEVGNILEKIFREVLSLSDLDKKSNFIESGGDSLKSIRIMAKIKELFAVELTFKDFFTCRDIECIINKVHSKLVLEGKGI